MKSKSSLFIITTLSLFSFSNAVFGQAPNLGIAANFTLFTVTGAMDNTGVTTITGNIGTNTGAISGFGTVNGGVYHNNSITRQCSTDVIAAYTQLSNTAATSTTHTPAFGGGETLVAGIYAIAAAGSVAGVLNLDAQGDPNAVFIFKFGGAFTTAASSTINLINGASACNVFWGADGAIAMAAGTIMKGTLIANNGAVSMGDGGTLEGRMLSTTGAVSVYGDYIYNSCGFITLPIELQSFTGTCDRHNVILKWSTASEAGNNYFTVEHSAERTNWQAIGIVKGAGSSSSLNNYSFIGGLSDKLISYYRIKQTDFEGNHTYSYVVALKKCSDNTSENLTLHPNPSLGKFDLSYSGNTYQVHKIEIFNSQGQKLYESVGYQQKFDLSNNGPGVYFMIVHLYSKAIHLKIVIAK
ncbi:MAG: hypothetical protein JWM28_1371 [Chitinophagaceae bacterium]|nr:hypothetical protein [Chitinophagaceae bacterium]